MRWFVGLGCAFAASLLASTVFADEGPAPQVVTESTTTTVDTVHLRSGGLFRGRVHEIVPGDHVSIVLPTAETKRIPWAEVDRVEYDADVAILRNSIRASLQSS